MKTEFDTTICRERQEEIETLPFQSSPTDKTTSTLNDDHEIVSFAFEPELRNKLNSFSQENDLPHFIALLGAFKVLLYRYNNQEGICIKNLADEYSQLLHQDINGQISFTDLLERVKEATNGTADAGQIHSGAEGEPKIMFVMTRAGHGAGNEEINFELTGEDAKCDLTFIVDENTCEGAVRFSKKVHDSNTIKQMIVHYKQLLYATIREPHQKIGRLQMLTPAEEHELLVLFNDTEKEVSKKDTIISLFEEQAAKAPDSIALCQDNIYMTYEELNGKANRLAHHLIAEGVQKQDNVGLVATRSFDMIVGMYAILKAGAAYVPIDPDYPAERQQYIIKQSSVKFLVANTATQSNDPAVKIIDMNSVAYEKYCSANPTVHVHSSQLAYTIYTSGSTGVPKGVMIEHHSVVNLIDWVNTTFNVCADDRLLFVTSMCFDLSVYDIFGMLAAGGSLVIVRKEEVPDAAKIAELIREYGVTFWDSVPTTMDHLVNRLENINKDYKQTTLRLVFMSGDWIPVNLPDKIKKFFPAAQVISLGGATEGTVWSNYFVINEVDKNWHSIPYGNPITNNAFYILNDELQPMPYGVIGELYIGGIGVAKGYANDAEKTRKAFLPDPFTAKWGGQMYRTGDLGRMRPDRTMEFIGRIDNQVKIRGHRVELGEIECVIRQCATVSNAVVLFNKEKQQLVSYVVPGKYYDRDTVIAHLKSKVPEYMMPGKWIELDSMPLTANGKMDTNALRNIDNKDQLKSQYVAPRNEDEKTLRGIWQKLLGTAEIGVNDNFFNLGGQSLMALELVTEIEKATGKSLPVNILYKYPTIAQLCSYLAEEGVSRKWKSLVNVKPSGTKMPVYIVHGDGLSVSNFENLAAYVDADQPVFSLQPIGLNGTEEPLENISDIARHYINEIVEHNPDGPYALGGYSFGGYVAIEMKKQLEAMGKNVKMLAIFDTDAQNATYKTNWAKALPKRIKRQVPKFLFIAKSMFTRPVSTMRYQYTLFSKKLNNLCYTLGIKDKPELTGVNKHISKINETHLRAFKKYTLTPFNDKVHLFKAKSRLYFVDDFKYLGWTDYAQRGVAVYDVPGDHKTMFQPPNVSELGRLLQHALDHC